MYQITEEHEKAFEDKNIEFAVSSLLQGKDKIIPKYAVMQVFNLSSKKANLCLRLTEEIKTLNK
tara:strand:+ start:58 stop:249 length:192 start_codon:yes stop_codon:yes gene_type:complete